MWTLPTLADDRVDAYVQLLSVPDPDDDRRAHTLRYPGDPIRQAWIRQVQPVTYTVICQMAREDR